MSCSKRSPRLVTVRATLLVSMLGIALAGCGYPDGPYEELSAPRFRVRSQLNICPQFLSYDISPLQASIEGKIKLEVEVEDVDDDVLFFSWYAPAGDFSSSDTLATSYTCKEEGQQLLLVAASDGKCDRAISFGVTCVEPPTP